jgi:hypothetical protein
VGYRCHHSSHACLYDPDRDSGLDLFGLVFVFGILFRDFIGQQQNPVVIVASTLIIAALFQPLCHGLQKAIDRRFYRGKYDAAKTLKNFSETLRGEIDLEQLSEHLLTVVQETMQPSSVSLWLRKQERNTSSRDQKPLE